MDTGTNRPHVQRGIARRLRSKPTAMGIAFTAAAALAAAWYHGGTAAQTPSSLSAFVVTLPPTLTVTYHTNGADILSDGSMVLPLDAYDAYAADPANEKLVFDAATAIEQNCMQAKGLILPADWGGTYLTTAPPPLVFYGVATMEDARQYGYRLPAPAPAVTQQPTVAQNVIDAFNGTPGHPGCASQAYNLLDIAKADDAAGTLENLRSQAQDSVIADSRLHTADTAWSACMKQAGLTYPNPLAPEHDRALLSQGRDQTSSTLPPPSPAEKHVAETDVACKDKTGYLQTYALLSVTYQQQVIQKNRTALQRALDEWTAVLHLARTHQNP